MPIGLEVNDYDSEADVSSTEDDNLNLPVVRNKNKKVKTKKKTEKKSILKESKIVKDKAKKKIKSMESEVKDINSVNYLDNNRVTFGQDEIREFYTDAELVDQLKELKKLEETQKKLWKYAANSHISVPETIERGRLYKSTMPSIFNSNSSMFANLRKAQNNSRTQHLNTSSRVNTSMPLMGGSRITNRSYNNIGKMW